MSVSPTARSLVGKRESLNYQVLFSAEVSKLTGYDQYITPTASPCLTQQIHSPIPNRANLTEAMKMGGGKRGGDTPRNELGCPNLPGAR